MVLSDVAAVYWELEWEGLTWELEWEGLTCTLLFILLHALEPPQHASQIRDAVLEGDALVLRRWRLSQDLPHVLLSRRLQF